MSKFFKKIMIGLSLSAVGFLAFKIYKFIKEAIELEKMLPQYLKTQFGEKPDINLMINFGSTTLTAKFSKEVLQKKDNIEKDIKEYVENYYPCLQKQKFKVVLEEKVDASAAEKEQQLKERILRAEEKINSLKNDTPKPKKKTTRQQQTNPNNKKTSKKPTEKTEPTKQPPKKKTTRRRTPKKTTKNSE
ncbi:MAG: hypothetical protein K9N09_06565 [Candidatus Cloacimonetes bacterium]|nr:hypothetical protein [Candidatus Cloacimonadota bacterium]MCF7813783.1 hypothetical protein [Candidatus Cloacimonadota bacterium]MCF7868345.1 hypothetical protein [Candidatus Cloacimonadota bacterium]MCF7883819.1 hypothetical protein [Candidatus Cloacimonadota bacterium]